MLDVLQKIRRISQQLYPTGKAFKFNYRDAQLGSFDDSFDASFDVTENVENPIRRGQFHAALAVYEEKAFLDAINILDASIPDNDNFTLDDAVQWERRLGIISNASISISDRKKAIIRKMNHPGNIRARQSAGYLESQLQLAGFDVKVYDNEGAIPLSSFVPLNSARQGQKLQGQFNQGSIFSEYPQIFQRLQQGQYLQGQINQGYLTYSDRVVNHIDYKKDILYNQSGWECVFYVGGQNAGEFASVPLARREELRQLILRLKPVQNIAYLLINYT